MTENKSSSNTFGLNIVLITAISSISLSLSDNNKITMPTKTATYQYSSINKYPWDITRKEYTKNPIDSEKEDFKIISLFAQRIVSQSKEIDDEIQEVINKSFWDML